MTTPPQPERRTRYAAVIRDTVNHVADLRTFDEQLADAVITVADTEQAELRRERDLAIAHDRQPYPTAWAYEQACKALNRKTEAIEQLLKWAAGLDVVAQELAGPEAKHPVAEHIRHLLGDETADRAAVCICGDTEQQHFEDACLVCDCGDYLLPEAAREVIGRLQQAIKQQDAEDPARIDRIRPEFPKHASIESIDAQLKRARAQERRWHIRTEWLISLRANRVAQQERGEWPAAETQRDGAQS